MPASLQTVIQDTFNLRTYQFEYLYSVYSFPSIIICLFGGVLIDKVFGLGWGSFIFALVALIGQIIITVGGFIEIYWLMLLGRFIYGVGAEPMILSLNCMCVIWFREKELNFVFGLFKSMTTLGTFSAFLIATPFYSFAKKSVPDGYVLGLSTSPSLVMVVIIVVCITSLAHMSYSNGMQITRSSSNTTSLKQFFNFPVTFWLVVMMLAICNGAIISFVSCSQQIFMKKYDISQGPANELGGLFNLLGALTAPLPGLIVDRLGRNMIFNVAGILFGIIAQLFFALTTWSPYIPIVLFAIYFSIINSCVLPLISLIVEPYQMGTAYGTLQCLTNLILTVSNIVAGFLLGRFGPFAVTLYVAANLVAALIFGITAWILDDRGRGVLNMSVLRRSILLYIPP